MSEETKETGTGETQETGKEETGTTGPASDTSTDLSGLREALDKERNLRREAEKKVKEAAGLKTKLDELTRAQMTEQEKAVAKAVEDAKAQAKVDTLASTAARLARAELRAAAAGRVEASALDGFLEYADLGKFVGADGEPDDKAIKAAVDKLAGPQRTSFDGGARTSAGSTTNMNQLIRDRAFGR